MNAMTAIVANPMEVIGGNNPPVDLQLVETREAMAAHIEDLLTEARNWADGEEVTTQAQADAVGKLRADLQQALKDADAVRVQEQAPWTDRITESQDWWNAYIAPLKNKAPGKLPRAVDALGALLKPFLDALLAEKAAIAEARRVEAERLANLAAEALRASQATDLASRDAAAALVKEATAAQADAKRAANDRPLVQGGARATGLKKTWTAVMVDRRAALTHYATARPEALQAFLQGLADTDVALNHHQPIPGFTIVEGTKV